MPQATTFGRRGAPAPAPARTNHFSPARPAAPPPAFLPPATLPPAALSHGETNLAFLVRLLFSFEGRLDRRTYRWTRAIWYVCITGLLYGEQALLPTLHGDLLALLIFLPFAAAFPIVMLWSTFAMQVKRRHDRDKTWPWLFVGFIPIAGPIWVLVECCFLDGTPGPNRFGPSPRGDPASVFD
jgi:uncharacterized membrane protein YhaH (DUF805 family)